MASGSNSGESRKTRRNKNEASETAKKNEYEVKMKYLKETLPASAPIEISKNVSIIEQQKKGYKQVKYKWKEKDYNYEARWHTRTSNAPKDQGDSWVISRHKLGIGYGSNPRKSIIEYLVGNNKWISSEKWNQAILYRKKNIINKEMEDILKHGHWKPKRKY